MRRIFFILICLSLLSSCTHSVHIVNFTDFKPYNQNKSIKLIESKAEQSVVLWYADNTNYVNEALKRLQEQCPRGGVTGIATQFYTSHGFFSWTNHVVMQGQCLAN